MVEDLINALADLQEKEALGITEARLKAGEDPLAILDDARKAMSIVGERFGRYEYFIPDLIYSGEILRQISEIIKPNLVVADDAKRLGRVIIATVAGDIHDIGKDIVVFMLDVNGFEVFDLGVDVPSQQIVAKINETGAPIVGFGLRRFTVPAICRDRVASPENPV